MIKLQNIADGVRAGNVRALAKAITLIESRNLDHSLAATTLLDELLPDTGQSIRSGISGVPGAGKSTFIEAFGMYLLQQGHKVAVLAVDPSSQLSGGSILGDKTRMEELARQQYANALHMLKPKSLNWQVPALLCSALHGEGIAEAWAAIEDFRVRMQQSGEFENKRRLQASDWMWTVLIDDIKEMFLRDRNVEALLGQVQDAVANGTTTPSAAARRLLEAFKRN